MNPNSNLPFTNSTLNPMGNFQSLLSANQNSQSKSESKTSDPLSNPVLSLQEYQLLQLLHQQQQQHQQQQSNFLALRNSRLNPMLLAHQQQQQLQQQQQQQLPFNQNQFMNMLMNQANPAGNNLTLQLQLLQNLHQSQFQQPPIPSSSSSKSFDALKQQIQMGDSLLSAYVNYISINSGLPADILKTKLLVAIFNLAKQFDPAKTRTDYLTSEDKEIQQYLSAPQNSFFPTPTPLLSKQTSSSTSVMTNNEERYSSSSKKGGEKRNREPSTAVNTNPDKTLLIPPPPPQDYQQRLNLENPAIKLRKKNSEEEMTNIYKALRNNPLDNNSISQGPSHRLGSVYADGAGDDEDQQQSDENDDQHPFRSSSSYYQDEMMKRGGNKKVSFYAWDGLLIEKLKNRDINKVEVPTLTEYLKLFENKSILNEFEYGIIQKIVENQEIDSVIDSFKSYAIENNKKNDFAYKLAFGWDYLKEQLKAGRTQMLTTVFWSTFVSYLYYHPQYEKFKITDNEFRERYLHYDNENKMNKNSINPAAPTSATSSSQVTMTIGGNLVEVENSSAEEIPVTQETNDQEDSRSPIESGSENQEADKGTPLKGNNTTTSSLPGISYGPYHYIPSVLFGNIDELEIKRLIQFRNVLNIAFTIIPPQRNEVLLLKIAAVFERSGHKYQISKSGQTMITTRRRYIFRQESIYYEENKKLFN